jgi:FAD-linked sulfhydryl oxidase
MQFWKRIITAFSIFGFLGFLSFTYNDTSSIYLPQDQVVYMPKLKNDTLRAKLGNAGWYLLHTISTKYPKTPTYKQEQEFQEFLKLFAKFYPCGDCGTHFHYMLESFPPKTSSRSDIIEWTCQVHNMVFFH